MVIPTKRGVSTLSLRWALGLTLGGMGLWTPVVAAEAIGPVRDAVEVTQVTVIATRTPKTLADTPASVSVITKEQIEDHLVQDIKDLVRYEPGVSVRASPTRFTAAMSSTGRDGNSGFSIRGLEGNRVLIQVDGIRVPDAFSFGAQSVGRGGYVGLDTLKSVEILRGPGSALYGSDGLAGVVSMTTKDPSDYLKPGANFGGIAQLGYADVNQSTGGGLSVAGRSGAFEGALSYSYREGHERESAGTRDSRDADRTRANPEDNRFRTLLAKLVYRPAEGHRLGLIYDHQDQDNHYDVLSAITASTTALYAHDTTTRNRVSGHYQYQGQGWLKTLEAAIYAQEAKSKEFSDERRKGAPNRTRDNRFNSKVWGLSIQAQSELAALGVTHRLTYGIEASRTRQDSLRDGTVPPMGEQFPTRAFPTTDQDLTGVFVQDEIGLFQGRLKLYPAIRYDHYEVSPKSDASLGAFVPKGQSDGHVSPKLSALYNLTPQWGVLVNWAEGFKAPSPSQINNAFSNLAFNYRSIPNPNLKPEKSQTLEAGLRYEGTDLSAGVTAFHGEYDDFIEQVLVSGSFTPKDMATYQYVNLKSVEISGVEGRAAYRFSPQWRTTFAVSYARGSLKDKGSKTPLNSVDPLKMVAGLSYVEPQKRFGGELVLTHSDQKAQGRVAQDCSTQCYRPNAFTVADLTAWWAVTTDVKVRLGVFNLTDEKYAWWNDVRGLDTTSRVIDAYTQPGRTYSASLQYRF